MSWVDISLTSSRDIDALFKEGVVYHGGHVLLISRKVDRGQRRVMFVASRKVGNAIKRNRAKRLMRESYCRLVDQLPPNQLHIAWIARASCAKMKMQDIQKDMEKILSTI